MTTEAEERLALAEKIERLCNEAQPEDHSAPLNPILDLGRLILSEQAVILASLRAPNAGTPESVNAQMVEAAEPALSKTIRRDVVDGEMGKEFSVYNFKEMAQAALTAAFSAEAPPNAGGGVEGWKLVPIEPTNAMIGAGKQADFVHFHDGKPNQAAPVETVYRAMLAAGPPAPIKSEATPDLIRVYQTYFDNERRREAEIRREERERCKNLISEWLRLFGDCEIRVVSAKQWATDAMKDLLTAIDDHALASESQSGELERK